MPAEREIQEAPTPRRRLAPARINQRTFPMTQWLRIIAWLSVLGLVLASWTPGEDMIRTGVKGSLEHVAAYLISTGLFVLAYPRLSPGLVGGAYAICAGVLELGQLYVPGRHSQFEDFAASCFGVAIVILPALWMRRTPSRTRK
jgi:VanZ family protein